MEELNFLKMKFLKTMLVEKHVPFGKNEFFYSERNAVLEGLRILS